MRHRHLGHVSVLHRPVQGVGGRIENVLIHLAGTERRGTNPHNHDRRLDDINPDHVEEVETAQSQSDPLDVLFKKRKYFFHDTPSAITLRANVGLPLLRRCWWRRHNSEGFLDRIRHIVQGITLAEEEFLAIQIQSHDRLVSINVAGIDRGGRVHRQHVQS